MEAPAATAPFLYPTKALSRDQKHGLQGLLKASGLKVLLAVYDGDPSGDARRTVRERSRIVLTNLLGSHMAHVLARLKRIAAFHGAQPTFITATATLGNPQEHMGLKSAAVHLVNRSGAPAARRHVCLNNPPVVNQELGIRRSVLKQTVDLEADLVRAKTTCEITGLYTGQKHHPTGSQMTEPELPRHASSCARVGL